MIIIIQENRSPDNLFQDPNLIRSGADIQKAYDSVGVPLASCWDPGHAHGSWNTEYLDQQNGRSFCDVGVNYSACQTHPACPPDTYVQGPPADNTIKPYWDIAEAYGFANYFFQTNEGPSFPAHQFLFSGTSAPDAYSTTYYNYFDSENPGNGANKNAGCTAPITWLAKDITPAGHEDFYYTPPYPAPVPAGYPCYEHATLVDQMTNGTTWRYYGYDLDESIWNSPNAFYHICMPSGPGGSCQGADWRDGHVDLHDWDIFNDITVNCNLPNVAWVIPDGNYSDHPGDNNSGGPDWVADIINAVGQSTCTNPDRSSYWNSTAIFVLWDDWGGFYDHVSPYKVVTDQVSWGSGYTWGFRVPLLVVSAYTGTNTAGYISGACQGGSCQNDKAPYQHDFGSILNFIQYAFGMPQGEIGPQNWLFDDYWAPDYYGNGSCQQTTCPYGLSDFFHFGQSRSFKHISPQRYQPSDFVNLSAFGGLSNSVVPDDETP